MLKTLGITLLLIRTFTLAIFKTNLLKVSVENKLWNDPWHHYHVGLILVAIAALVGHFKLGYKPITFVGLLGAALVIEEYAVVLWDLKINQGSLMYLGLADNLILITVAILLIIFG